MTLSLSSISLYWDFIQIEFYRHFLLMSNVNLIMQSGELNRLSFYFDTDTKPWPMEKSWEELVPQDWSKVRILPSHTLAISGMIFVP